MTDVKQYRRKDSDDTTIYTAIQYGNEDQSWDAKCMPRVAQFVLGLDVDTRVTIANERVMDVVQPVQQRWQPEHMVADIRVADWPRGTTYQVRLGDWLLKDEVGNLLHVGYGDFKIGYELVVPVLPPRTTLDDLEDLVYAHFPWQGDIYRATARRIAGSILNAGYKPS